MTTATETTCPSCHFWGTLKDGRCAWCEEPAERCEYVAHGPLQLGRPFRRMRKFAAWHFLRTVKAGRILLADKTIPRRYRLLLGVGLLPVPGPLDELALAVAVGLLWWLHRDAVRRAFAEAGGYAL